MAAVEHTASLRSFHHKQKGRIAEAEQRWRWRSQQWFNHMKVL
jgi:hypothetical protein